MISIISKINSLSTIIKMLKFLSTILKFLYSFFSQSSSSQSSSLKFLYSSSSHFFLSIRTLSSLCFLKVIGHPGKSDIWKSHPKNYPPFPEPKTRFWLRGSWTTSLDGGETSISGIPLGRSPVENEHESGPWG